MRQIVLDTETTGLDPGIGHRIIEIGCVELSERRPTGRNFHQYLQPDREIDAGAVQVHGITNDFLADKPRFADIAGDLMAYLQGAELIIHNAPFDVGFLNAELARLDDWQPLGHYCTITDSLSLARAKHPGQRNSLDALCGRYQIDNSHREKHGALLDAEILAEVYLAMTGGQVGLSLEPIAERNRTERVRSVRRERVAGDLLVVRAKEAELAAHEARLVALDKSSQGQTLWRKLDG